MENCWEEVPHTSQDYYPHYNLFQSSIFYDTDNFRVSYLSYRYDDCSSTESGTNCAENQEKSAEPPDKPPEETAVTQDTGSKENRTVTRDELYVEPDIFCGRGEEPQPTPATTEPPYLANSQPWGYDWTKESWVKSGGKQAVMNRVKERKEDRRKKELFKQLTEAPRVKISKVESMMQKMGWQGGALGKSSDGIEEPITPNTHYAFRNIGFGERTERPVKPPKNPPKTQKNPKKPIRKTAKRDIFRTNVLMRILEFVQDDTEIELLFDATLRRYERRFIHTLVQNVINDDNVVNLASVAQYDLVADIRKCSQYHLSTVSEGKEPNRQIMVYKEAPEHVYLVTPEDFQPKEDTDEQTDTEQATDNQNKENVKAKNAKVKNEAGKSDDKVDKNDDSMEMDDDENPFLKSIKNSSKRDDEPKNITKEFEKDCNIAEDDETSADLNEPSLKDKLLEFFLEFVDSEAFKQLRFLGRFSSEQTAAVHELLDDISACIEDLGSFVGNQDLVKVFKRGDVRFEIKEGPNGTTEIHKMPTRTPP